VCVFYLFIAKDIIQAISSCQNLHYLNLEGNTLGVDAAKGIAKALESHSEFKRALWKDMFTGRMKTEIPKALVSIVIYNNQFLDILRVCRI
jgi:Ran GTPase-activating protein 1